MHDRKFETQNLKEIACNNHTHVKLFSFFIWSNISSNRNISSMTAAVTIHFHCMEERWSLQTVTELSDPHALTKSPFFVSLEQHEGE